MMLSLLPWITSTGQRTLRIFARLGNLSKGTVQFLSILGCAGEGTLHDQSRNRVLNGKVNGCRCSERAAPGNDSGGRNVQIIRQIDVGRFNVLIDVLLEGFPSPVP